MKIPETYKGQLYLLFLIVILPLLTLWFSVGKTIKLYIRSVNQNRLLNELTISSGNSSQKSGTQHIFHGAFPNYIFPVILKNNCIIHNYTPFITQNSGEYTLYTHEITVKGDFLQILRIVEKLEGSENLFKIISVEFSVSTQTFENKSPELKMKILIQHIAKS